MEHRSTSPPLQDGGHTGDHPGGVPTQLTSFIGRTAEIAEAMRLLERGPLLTLTGPGGSGKTRLAIEVASRSGDAFAGGVHWVDLAPLSDPELVERRTAAALGVRDVQGETTRSSLLSFLHGRELLLVLDNCEHVVGACAELVDGILRCCPGVRVLATSREPLGISGETAWLIPTLSLPDSRSAETPDQLSRYEAVRLFMERAQAVLPAFGVTEANARAVARIVLRLDGLPLAIELAAARVNMLGLEQIASRLDDCFSLLTSRRRTALPRQQTLRATIDWSYELLTGEERVLLQRLSVFVGGFCLEAAEVVCAGEDLDPVEVLDLLSRLVDKSLVLTEVHEGDARYRLLETVRQYAQEKLRTSGDSEAVRARHARFFLELAEASEPHTFNGVVDRMEVARVDEELPNIRAAADWFEAEEGRTDQALRLASALLGFWFARGHLREGRQRLALAQRRRGHASPPVLAKALTSLGFVAFLQGDYGQVLGPCTEGVAILRGLDDRRTLFRGLVGLGVGKLVERDPAGARSVFEEAVGIGRAEGEGMMTAYALHWRGRAARSQGDPELAEASFTEAVTFAREAGYRPGIAHPLVALAGLACARGDHEAAARLLHESLAIHRENDDRWGIFHVLEGFADVARARGAPERAAMLLGAAEEIREQIGAPSSGEDDHYARIIAQVRGALDDAAFTHAWSHGRALPLQEALNLAPTAGADPPPATIAPAAPAPAASPAPVVPPEPAAPEAAPGLSVRALGAVEVYVEGVLLDPGAWEYAKPRELLLFLLCHPRGRTRDEIGLALWPDASAAQVRNNFHVTLHHLRKTLGRSEWVVYSGDRYLLSPDLAAEFDALRFEREVLAALQAEREGSGGPEALGAALALYRGDFLEGEVAGDWHLDVRGRLQRLYLDGLLALGRRCVAGGDYAGAVDAYQRVLIRDDLSEEAHRQLMVCRARLGARAEAMRHYLRYAETLREELGVDPDQETRLVYERLQREEMV